ncbi:MAG: hypothetical protein CMQ11_08775 [Gammaproteobacteria bacterium]|nr:hypothetical protein [Gammaproteobacteria bacterium]
MNRVCSTFLIHWLSLTPLFARLQVLTSDGSLEPARRPVIVEDLLTHRSGFSYEFITGCHIAAGYDAAKLSSDGSCPLDDMMTKLAAQPLPFQPGSQFRYSVSTDALAHVIKKATGKPLQALLKQNILNPWVCETRTSKLTKRNDNPLCPCSESKISQV